MPHATRHTHTLRSLRGSQQGARPRTSDTFTGSRHAYANGVGGKDGNAEATHRYSPVDRPVHANVTWPKAPLVGGATHGSTHGSCVVPGTESTDTALTNVLGCRSLTPTTPAVMATVSLEVATGGTDTRVTTGGSSSTSKNSSTALPMLPAASKVVC
jgi:hypothetical protein